MRNDGPAIQSAMTVIWESERGAHASPSDVTESRSSVSTLADEPEPSLALVSKHLTR